MAPKRCQLCGGVVGAVDEQDEDACLCDEFDEDEEDDEELTAYAI